MASYGRAAIRLTLLAPVRPVPLAAAGSSGVSWGGGTKLTLVGLAIVLAATGHRVAAALVLATALAAPSPGRARGR